MLDLADKPDKWKNLRIELPTKPEVQWCLCWSCIVSFLLGQQTTYMSVVHITIVHSPYKGDARFTLYLQSLIIFHSFLLHPFPLGTKTEQQLAWNFQIRKDCLLPQIESAYCGKKCLLTDTVSTPEVARTVCSHSYSEHTWNGKAVCSHSYSEHTWPTRTAHPYWQGEDTCMRFKVVAKSHWHCQIVTLEAVF